MANWYQTSASYRLERPKTQQPNHYGPTVQDEVDFSRSLQSAENKASEVDSSNRQTSLMDDRVSFRSESEKRRKEQAMGEQMQLQMNALSFYDALLAQTETDSTQFEAAAQFSSSSALQIQAQSTITSDSTVSSTTAEGVLIWLDTEKQNSGDRDWYFEIQNVDGSTMELQLNRAGNGDWTAILKAQADGAEFRSLELALRQRGVLLRRAES